MQKILFTPHFIIRIALSNCKINGLLVDLGIILCLISWKSVFLRPILHYFSSYSSRKIARRASSSVKSRALELLGSPLQPLARTWHQRQSILAIFSHFPTGSGGKNGLNWMSLILCPDHIFDGTQKSSIQKISLFHGAKIFFYHLGL